MNTAARDLKARSPWARHTDKHQVTLTHTGEAVSGRVVIPGSKSYTNRALIIAAAAKGNSALGGVLQSDDSYWCASALRELGVSIDLTGEKVSVTGCDCLWPKPKSELYIGAGGTTARFLPGLLAASGRGPFTIKASESMSKRPVLDLMEGLKKLGASVQYLNTSGFYPLQIGGEKLHGGEVTLSGKISSQFISGTLMALPYAKEQVTLNVIDGIVQKAYVLITVQLMRLFGADVAHDEALTKFVVEPTGYTARELTLEADASNAAYFFALAAITGGTLEISNLPAQTLQPDILVLGVLEQMGCTVEILGETGVRVTGPKKLRGGFTVSLREFSDQTLTIAALAPFADAPISIREVAHIRHHESDRIHAMASILSALGITVDEHDDGLTVHPGTPKAATVESYDDHRIAMSLGVLAAKCPGITILDPGCVSKTFPEYFEYLGKMGFDGKFA